MGEAKRKQLAGTVTTPEETQSYYLTKSKLGLSYVGPPSPKGRRNPKPLFSVKPSLKSKGAKPNGKRK